MLNFLSRHLVTGIVAAVASANTVAIGMSAESPVAATRRPNVVFILADDLGYSDLGCYGGEIETPNLDKLAAGGLRFTQFYNTARCWPTRGTLLTGFYAQAVRCDAAPGVVSGPKRQRPSWARLLPEYLKPAGYRSYQSGKWHVDGPVLAGGFDHSYLLDDHNRNFAPQKHSEDDKPLPPVSPGTDYFTSTAVADHAIRCLKEHAAEHADRPFFSYVAFTSPHFPLQAPANDIAKYRERYVAGWEAIRAERIKRMQAAGLVSCELSVLEREVGPPYAFPDDIAKLGLGEVNRPLPWGELTEAQHEFQAAKMAVHAAMVDRMDQEIGRIVAQLTAMNALENTVIMFASDNGASAEIMVRGDGHDQAAAPGSAATFLCLGPGFSSAANTPFRRHKTWVHEGGVSTPLVVHWPAGIAARGELRHNTGHIIDITPTVLDLADVTAPAERDGKPVPPMHGRSLVPAFAIDGSVKHEELWWLHEGNRAVRVADMKLVAAKDQPWELYNLKTDRGESHNLAAEQPAMVTLLEGVWNARLKQFVELANSEAPPATNTPPARRNPNKPKRQKSPAATPTP